MIDQISKERPGVKMKFKETEIKGCFIIESELFNDGRGVFRRHFDAESFKEHGIVAEVNQCDISQNFERFTLRGFHYQIPPHSEGKTLSCIKGAIYDIVVDLRPDSKTFLKWCAFTLDEKNCISIHVPPGCATAFLTLESNTTVHYYRSKNYNSESERGIRYNDPLFNFVWPHEPEMISEKDKSRPDFVVNK